MNPPLRSILAATDLSNGSDVIVQAAARLAAQTGAGLHLLHALELPRPPSGDVALRAAFEKQMAEAEHSLRAQARCTMPEDVAPASEHVGIPVAHRAIKERAAQVEADLIVIGRHRGGAAGAHFLGTTAGRVIRMAEIPCLVVGDPLAEPIRRIGVAIDCSDPSQGALEIALAWALQASGEDEAGKSARPEIRVMHVGWTVEWIDDPQRGSRVLLPKLERLVEHACTRVPGSETLDVRTEVLWGNDPIEATVLWGRRAKIDLLVMGTRGSTGLRRVLLGSTASSVARQAHCPVLLVPPSLWSGEARTPRLQRVLVATDFAASALEAARWSTRCLAPEAEHLLVHVLEVPEPPAVLAGRYGPREELLWTARKGVRQRLEEQRHMLEEQRRTLETAPDADGAGPIRTAAREGGPADEMIRLAEESGADLIVMGSRAQDGREHSAWTWLGTTAERVLRASPTPVLLVRGRLQGPPRNLLVAVDGSEPSLGALAWANFLRSRFGAALTALHVETPFIFEYGDLLPTSTELSALAARASAEQPDWLLARTNWLRDEMRRAGADPDAASIRVTVGRPADEIVAEQERGGADLVVLGTHGRGALARVLLGSVASAVLRTVPCSVLAVGDPDRMRR